MLSILVQAMDDLDIEDDKFTSVNGADDEHGKKS